MSGEAADPGSGDGAAKLAYRAVGARAEAVVLLGDIRSDLIRWSSVLEEVEQAVRSDTLRPLEEHAKLVAARNRLFDVLAELAALADPYLVWAVVSPDGADPS